MTLSALKPTLRMLAGAALGLVAAALAFAQGAELTASADSVKAAYLFKLPGYVDWPSQRFERPDSPLVVGVLAADDVAEALAMLTEGRTSNGRPVVVRRLRLEDELAGLHVLFFGGDARERAARIAADAAAQNILTVADLQAGFDDSVIDFVLVNGRMRFEVRLNAAERNGLRLHAGLLDVASRVQRARR